MIWILYGILHSAMRAVFAEAGRVFKADAERQAFWQALIALLILVPFTPLMVWPSGHGFYIAAGGVSLIMTVGSLVNIGLSQQRRGRESGIHMPLEALTAFIIWLVITPAMAHHYATHPLMAAGLAIGFALASFALVRIRPGDIGWQTFFIVIPIGLSYAVAGAVTKTLIPPFAVLPLAMSYATVNFAVMALVMGFSLIVKGKMGKAMVEKRLLKAGLVTGLSSAISYTAFVVSVGLAPNPGYTSALAMLVPVWLLVWHRLRGVEDKTNPVAAACVVTGIAILIGAVSFL